jgi:methionyl-tRNA formyltransferase
MTRAVVFAYHNVGVRCLSVLMAHGLEIPLVITHKDSPSETIWFDSVEELATRAHLPSATPDDPNAPEWVERIRALKPDFIFSFYYRQMLRTEILDAARLGAYNMHGSLLPKYRGRVPINWAIIQGERHSGATLHRMVAKPDAGAMVSQQSVPILPDDTAFDVFQKVTVAAEIALDAALPKLIQGTATHTPLDLAQGSYYGGRKPEDGRIDWTLPADRIHNLIRAVAPPYPGAFADVRGKHLRILRSRIDKSLHAQSSVPALNANGNRLYVDCVDGRVVELLSIEFDGKPLGPEQFPALFGAQRVLLTE